MAVERDTAQCIGWREPGTMTDAIVRLFTFRKVSSSVSVCVTSLGVNGKSRDLPRGAGSAERENGRVRVGLRSGPATMAARSRKSYLLCHESTLPTRPPLAGI
jgi:hypothetical protein